jgi:signal transduction histidine kinase
VCHDRDVVTSKPERSGPPANAAWVAACALGPFYVLGAVAVALGPGRFSTHAGRSVAIATLAACAGLALIGAGFAARFGPPGMRIGALSLAAGYLWFAPVWVGWGDGPPLIRSLAMPAAAFLLPVLVHLIVAYPGGRLRSRIALVLVAVVYAEAAISAIGRALLRDPLRVANCWDNCSANSFLLKSLSGPVHSIETFDLWFGMATGLAIAALCLGRLLTGTKPARTGTWPVMTAGVVIAAATVAHSVALTRAAEDASDPAFVSIYVGLAVGVALLGAALLADAARARHQRQSVERIATSLGQAPAPGSLQPALARIVGDPGLTIAYRLESPTRYVDPVGRTVPEPDRRGATPGPATAAAAVTTVVRDGREVAAITHAVQDADLERAMGAAVRLALENERLRAETLSQAEDIRASRARIVEAGDAARRRLERDLHDGAQQRLLALSFELRLARAKAEADGDGGAAAELGDATGETLRALAELRELAHGIFPAILTEAGLGPALATLADSAPIAVDVDFAQADGRLPTAVETAAYVVASEAIDDAAARGATRVEIRADRGDGRLVILVCDDGAARTTSMIHLADRAGALGGAVEAEPGMLRAEIPCA